MTRSLEWVEVALDAAGMNLRAALPPPRYDALVPPAWRASALLPDARTALVVASGGRALWRALRGSPELATDPDPVDAYTARALGELVGDLVSAGQPSRALFAFERHGGAYADFVALGRAAGLGGPSRLGLLIHPEYGPWLSIRAVLLTTLAWPQSAAPIAFDPCTGCPAPCAGACPTAAPGVEGFSVAACDAGRSREPACLARCAARRACWVGPRHAYDDEAEAHHMRHAR